MANLSAAIWFRSRYQLSADFNSASADGWISSGLAAIEDSGDLPSRLCPRDGFHFAGIQLLDATRYFLVPLLFGGRVQGILQAFQKRTCQGGTRLWRKCQCLL